MIDKEKIDMKQKRIAIAGVSAAMLVGAGTGIVLNLPSGAGATGSPSVATNPTDPTENDHHRRERNRHQQTDAV